jgi:phospholipid/cholesterol/gamma-HCH transport system permease protein
MQNQDSSGQAESKLRQFFWELADTILFSGKVIQVTVRGRFEWAEFRRQCYVIGLKTLGLISITAFIMGLVLTIQTRPVMAELGSWWPSSGRSPP